MSAIEKSVIYSYSFWCPPIEVFALLYGYSSILLIEAHENYQKRSWRNRSTIMGPQGTQLLSVPLEKGKNNKMPIQSVRIAKGEEWKKEHLKSIHNNYRSAPYFDHYFPKIEQQYQKKQPLLWNWNLDWIYFWKENLGFHFDVEHTSKFGPRDDAFNSYDEKERKILKSLYNDAFWYPQVFEEDHGFIRNVSIIDMLFCAGPETRDYLKEFFILPLPKILGSPSRDN